MNTAKIGRIIENEIIGMRATVYAISDQNNEMGAVAKLRCADGRTGEVTFCLIVLHGKIKKFFLDDIRKQKVLNAKNVWPMIFKEFSN